MKNKENTPDCSQLETVSAGEKAAALNKVLNSGGFENSPKLREFLSYIAHESAEGRSEQIKGKTIAVDVYGRAIEDGASGHNIVRVEARRLRRLLDDYYLNEGNNDPVRVHMDPGGYAPRFEIISRSVDDTPTSETSDAMEVQQPQENALKNAGSQKRTIFVGLIVCLAVIASIFALNTEHPPQDEVEPDFDPERMALREHSVQSLQARDIANNAREMIFPLFDARRLNMALDAFTYAVELSPELPDGYVGAAQVHATLHLIVPNETEQAKHLEAAWSAINKASEIAPTNAWVLSAKSWVLAQSGQQSEAVKVGRLALSLAPNNGHVLDLVGIAAIYANEPRLAAEVSDPSRNRQGIKRIGTQNIWGLANLMLGKNAETVKAFEMGPASGAVIAGPALVFRAIAHDRLGQTEQAKSMIRELNQTWPDFPTEFLMRRVFKHNEDILKELLLRFDRMNSEL